MMNTYHVQRRDSTEEEFFLDSATALARQVVLERDQGAEGVMFSVARNHHWMAPDAIWYCVRWTHTRGVK